MKYFLDVMDIPLWCNLAPIYACNVAYIVERLCGRTGYCFEWTSHGVYSDNLSSDIGTIRSISYIFPGYYSNSSGVSLSGERYPEDTLSAVKDIVDLYKERSIPRLQWLQALATTLYLTDTARGLRWRPGDIQMVLAKQFGIRFKVSKLAESVLADYLSCTPGGWHSCQ